MKLFFLYRGREERALRFASPHTRGPPNLNRLPPIFLAILYEPWVVDVVPVT